MKPVSTASGPWLESTVTVWVWPPRRWSRSKRNTSCLRLRSQAAARPEIPEPITATVVILQGSGGAIFGGDRAEGPQLRDDAHPAQRGEDPVSEIDLPPAKSLQATARRVVVIVVPAFAEGDDREQEIV